MLPARQFLYGKVPTLSKFKVRLKAPTTISAKVLELGACNIVQYWPVCHYIYHLIIQKQCEVSRFV